MNNRNKTSTCPNCEMCSRYNTFSRFPHFKEFVEYFMTSGGINLMNHSFVKYLAGLDSTAPHYRPYLQSQSQEIKLQAQSDVDYYLNIIKKEIKDSKFVFINLTRQ